MSLSWVKVWRDLWTNKSRTMLVVLAVAVGVVAFGGVFATKDLLLTGMTSQYQATNPAPIILSIPSGFSDELVTWAVNQSNVLDARGVGSGLVRVYTDQGSRNLELQSTDFKVNRVNHITPETGIWPPERREIVLERKSLPLLATSLGQSLTAELPNGDKKNVTFVGTVHDYQAIPANLFPQLTGYVTFSTLTWLGFPDHYTQLQIVPTKNILTKDQAQAVADTVKHKLEQRGYDSINVRVEKPGKHWGEDPTNAFVTIMTVVGAFSLVLSIFLVVNTISAVIAQQKKQIGIMKAIGGTNRQLVSLYLFMALILGLLALGVALPLGALMSYGNLVLLTNFLNLNIVGFTIPLWIVGLEVAASLGVPLIAALIPVMVGMKTTVREALSDLVVNRHQNSVVDDLTKKVKFLDRPTLLSIRNLFRKRGRLILTLTTLTIAGTLFLSVQSVQKGMMKELSDFLNLYHYDVELFFGQKYDSQFVVRTALKTPGVIAAESPIRISAQQLTDSDQKGETIPLIGLSPDTNFMKPQIIAGRWLLPSDRNQIVVSSKLIRDNPALSVGKDLNLSINDKNRTFEIVGVYMLADEANGIVSASYLKHILPDANLVSSVRVQSNSPSGQGLIDLAKRLEQDLKNKGLNVAYSLTIDTIRQSSEGQFSFMILFLMIMAAMVAVVGGLGLAGTMSLNVLERTREIGVMRSIGASNRNIRSMVSIEGILIGLLSWAIAIPVSIPVSIGFCYAVGKAFFEKPLTYTFPLPGIAIWLGIVTLIAALASVAPASRASKLTIRETLAYE